MKIKKNSFGFFTSSSYLKTTQSLPELLEEGAKLLAGPAFGEKVFALLGEEGKHVCLGQ